MSGALQMKPDTPAQKIRHRLKILAFLLMMIFSGWIAWQVALNTTFKNCQNRHKAPEKRIESCNFVLRYPPYPKSAYNSYKIYIERGIAFAQQGHFTKATDDFKMARCDLFFTPAGQLFSVHNDLKKDPDLSQAIMDLWTKTRTPPLTECFG